MHRPTPRLIKPLLTLALVTTLAGCCGCLPPPGIGGPRGGGRGGPAPHWHDAQPPHWQERGAPEDQRQRPRPRHADPDNAPREQP